MSSNEIKFLTINSQAKWQKMMSNNVKKEMISIGKDGLSLGTTPTYDQNIEFKIPLNTIVDVVVDHCDFLYILYSDDKKGIQAINPNTGFYESTDYDFTNPQSIEVGLEFTYVLDGKSISIISKTKTLVKNIRLDSMKNPSDIAIDKDDTLYVLDRGLQVYRLSKTGIFEPVLDNDSIAILLQSNAIRLEIDKNQKFCLLDSKNNAVLLFSEYGKYEKSIPILGKIDPKKTMPAQLSFGVYDKQNLFLILEKNLIVESVLAGDSNLHPFEQSDHIAINKRNGNLYLFDEQSENIISFKIVSKFISSATYIANPLDSTLPKNIWHKLVLDAAIPQNTSLDVSYYATDALTEAPEENWSSSIHNPEDSLINAVGRYLWIKVTLSSYNKIDTPQLASISAYFPRISYLRYLPQIYSEDPKSKDFMERFLSIFETLNLSVDKKIRTFSSYLDPQVAPAEFLPWLASWLGLRLDEGWPQDRARALLKMLPSLYRMRGTKRGLEKILLLYLEGRGKETDEISKDMTKEKKKFFTSNGNFVIIENFQLQCARDGPKWSEYKMLFGDNPYLFCVLLDSRYSQNEIITGVTKIVENERPAHTSFSISCLEPFFQLGNHTYLGVNTFLNKQILTIGRSTLGRDSVIVGDIGKV